MFDSKSHGQQYHHYSSIIFLDVLCTQKRDTRVNNFTWRNCREFLSLHKKRERAWTTLNTTFHGPFFSPKLRYWTTRRGTNWKNYLVVELLFVVSCWRLSERMMSMVMTWFYSEQFVLNDSIQEETHEELSRRKSQQDSLDRHHLLPRLGIKHWHWQPQRDSCDARYSWLREEHFFSFIPDNKSKECSWQSTPV